MKTRIAAMLLALAASTPAAAQWRVSSDQSVGGFKFPESAGYDAKGKMLYVGSPCAPRFKWSVAHVPPTTAT